MYQRGRALRVWQEALRYTNERTAASALTEMTIQRATPRMSGRTPTALSFGTVSPAPIRKRVSVSPRRAAKTMRSKMSNGFGAQVLTAAATKKRTMNQGIVTFAARRCTAKAVPSARGMIQSARVSFTVVRDLKCLGAEFRRRADHRARVVDRHRGPYSELRLRQAERNTDRREDEESDGVEDEDRSERNRHLLVGGPHHRADRGDRAASADRRSRRD